MKRDHQSQPTKRKLKPSASSLQLQPLSMVKTRGIGSTTEKKTLRVSQIEQSSAIKRAEEIQASFPSEFPTLVKYMLPSHTGGCFCLNLPKRFCREYLPKSDSVMKLIDEAGNVSNSKFLVGKAGLSGGWRGFAIAHRLQEGDVVIFQLVEATTFKIYIIRRNEFGENDGNLGNMELVEYRPCGEETINSSQNDHFIKQAQCEEEGESESEVLDWIKVSEPGSVSLESYEKFGIQLDGSVSIDAKFPDHIRRKYYVLCVSQGAFLHENIVKGLNCVLIVGMINETVNISDAIGSGSDCVRRVEFSEDVLVDWDMVLQSFVLLGMNVGFIRMRIQLLLGRVLVKQESGFEETKEIE